MEEERFLGFLVLPQVIRFVKARVDAVARRPMQVQADSRRKSVRLNPRHCGRGFSPEVFDCPEVRRGASVSSTMAAVRKWS